MWVLYYRDGTKFTDQDGAPNDSPERGIVGYGCPSDYHQGGWFWETRSWYTFMDGRWWGHDTLTDLVLQLIAYAPKIEAVRRGEYVTDHEFREMVNTMSRGE